VGQSAALSGQEHGAATKDTMNFQSATPAQKAKWAKVLKLYESGEPQKKIAERYGVAAPVVNRWIARARKQREYEQSIAQAGK
jgi:DNA-binding transcriptional regulator LsrR (DeoR family)